MNDEIKKELFTAVDESVRKNLEEIVGKEVADSVEAAVTKYRLDNAIKGHEGLDLEVKQAFLEDLRHIATGEKAAYLTSSDQAGGYLVPSEMHAEIIRIAATTGIVARDAQRWPMGSDKLEIPRYTGSVLQGSYQGEDTEGGETQSDLGEAVLQTAYWQLVIRIGNRLLKNSAVNLADWFMVMAAEGLAYKLDREGFTGGTYVGSPFVGLLGSSEVTTQTMQTGKTGFDKFDMAEAADAIATIPTAAVSDGAFYFHRTVWSKLKSKKDAVSGLYEFSQWNSNLMQYYKEAGINPVGMIGEYPVFTSDVLPAFSASGISKVFGVFANMKLALAWGDRGPMEIAKSSDATVGGRNLFTANQTGFRFSHEHAISIALPAAAVLLKTSAS